MNAKPAGLQRNETRIGLVQIGIILLTVASAVIHLGLAFAAPDPLFTPLFIANGVAYLALLAGLFLPLPFARDNRGLVRWALIGVTALSILAWFAVGDKSWPQGALGYIDKGIELALIILLLADRQRS